MQAKTTKLALIVTLMAILLAAAAPSALRAILLPAAALTSFVTAAILTMHAVHAEFALVVTLITIVVVVYFSLHNVSPLIVNSIKVSKYLLTCLKTR